MSRDCVKLSYPVITLLLAIATVIPLPPHLSVSFISLHASLHGSLSHIYRLSSDFKLMSCGL